MQPKYAITVETFGWKPISVNNIASNHLCEARLWLLWFTTFFLDYLQKILVFFFLKHWHRQEVRSQFYFMYCPIIAHLQCLENVPLLDIGHWYFCKLLITLGIIFIQHLCSLVGTLALCLMDSILVDSLPGKQRYIQRRVYHSPSTVAL